MYIQKQSNGTYRVWVRRRGRSMSATFDRKADAEAYGRKAETSIEAGATIQFRKIKRTTLGDLLDLYEENVVSGRRYPGQERQRIRHWQATPLARRSLDALASEDFARYRDMRKQAGRADNTVRLELAFIGRLYNLARREWGFDGLRIQFPICRNREAVEPGSGGCCQESFFGFISGCGGILATCGPRMPSH